jgi:uncharacterized protein
MRTINMYPLDFEEFYIVNGLGEDVIAYLRQHYEAKTPIDEGVHSELIKLFYRCLVVGGMPEAIAEYLTSNDLDAVKDIHQKIIRECKRDFSKYESSKKLILNKLYDLIPAELGKN